MLPNQNVFQDSVFEPLYDVALLTVAAGPSVTLGTTVTWFDDTIGGATAGPSGIIKNEDETSFTRGMTPKGVGFEIFDASIWVHTDANAAPTEATLLALGACFVLRIWYADTPYRLGPLGLFLGPYGGPTGANNIVVPRRLAAVNYDGQPQGFPVQHGQQWKVDAKCVRPITAGAGVASYHLHLAMNRRVMRKGNAAVKVGQVGAR